MKGPKKAPGLVLILGICLLLVLVGARRLFQTRYPLPYLIEPKQLDENLLGLRGDPSAQFIYLGDRMAANFYRFKNDFIETISQDLSSPVKVSYLGGDKDGLHRSLHRLRSLKNLPKVILLHAPSLPHYELKFNQSQIEAIKQNMRLYQNPWVRTFRFFFRTGSGWIFNSLEPVTIDFAQIKTNSHRSESELIDQLGVNYHLVEEELESIIQFTFKHKIKLVLITAPINYLAPPARVCSIAKTGDYKELEKRVKELLEKGDSKTAYRALRTAADQSLGNAGYHYYMARTLHGLNQRNKAFEHAKLAVSFDCEKWRSEDIVNKIFMEKASEHDIILFNFNRLVLKDFMSEDAFIDNIFPQDQYYEQASKALGQVLRKALKI